MTENTPNSNPAPTTATASSEPTAAPTNPPDTKADPAKPADQPKTDTKPADTKPGDTKTDAKPKDVGDLMFDKPKEGDAPKEGEQKPEDKKDGDQPAFKIEDLKLPDDMPIAEGMKAPLMEVATKNKWTKEQAQEVADLGVKYQQQQLDQWVATKAEWRKQIETDPDLGGANLESTKLAANKVVNQFSSDPKHAEQMREVLVLLGLGNNLPFVRFLNNIAKATGNDRTSQDGKPGSGKTPASDSLEAKAQRMYPNMAP